MPKEFQPLLNKEGNLVDLFHFRPYHVDTDRINNAIHSDPSALTDLNPSLTSQLHPMEITLSKTENPK